MSTFQHIIDRGSSTIDYLLQIIDATDNDEILFKAVNALDEMNGLLRNYSDNGEFYFSKCFDGISQVLRDKVISLLIKYELDDVYDLVIDSNYRVHNGGRNQ